MSDNIIISSFPEVLPEQIASVHFAKTLPFNYLCSAMWNFGSRVYGNKNPSDIDIIAVFDGDFDYKEQHDIENINPKGLPLQVTLYSSKSFVEALQEHEISALECFYAKAPNILVPMDYKLQCSTKNFKIQKEKLHSSLMEKASHSYVKAKKKLTVPESFDVEVSVKSLWHSLRILDFGSQLAEHNCICDYESMNEFFTMILDEYIEFDMDWDSIHDSWKPIYNEYASTFRALCK